MSFPKYPEYKDTSVTWLGAITPADWNLLKGKRVFSQRKERALSEDQQLAASQMYGVIPQKKMMEMTGNNVMLALGGTNSFRRVVQDDFVISLRSFEGGIEHSAYNGCVSPAYTVLAPNRAIYPWFYRYLLKSRPYVSALQASTDSLRDGKSITFEQFGAIALPCPSVSEQRQIARFLDHETAKIDTLIHEQKRLIELLKEKRQAVISHAVTKGLDPDVPMKDSGVEWLGAVPAHWTLPKVAHYCNVTNGSTPDRSNAQFWNEGNIPWLSSSELNQFHITKAGENITEFALKRSSLSLIKRGAILIGLVGQGKTRGLSARLDIRATINQNVAAIIPRFDQVDSDFLHFILQHLYIPIREFGRGGQQAALNCEIIETIRIPLPPVNEQKQIAIYLTETLSALKQLSRMATQAIDTLQERRSALISAAVTGKIDVRDWQPPTNESTFGEEVRQTGLEAEA